MNRSACVEHFCYEYWHWEDVEPLLMIRNIITSPLWKHKNKTDKFTSNSKHAGTQAYVITLAICVNWNNYPMLLFQILSTRTLKTQDFLGRLFHSLSDISTSCSNQSSLIGKRLSYFDFMSRRFVVRDLADQTLLWRRRSTNNITIAWLRKKRSVLKIIRQCVRTDLATLTHPYFSGSRSSWP